MLFKASYRMGVLWGIPHAESEIKHIKLAFAEEKGGRLCAQQSPDVKVRLIIYPFYAHGVCGPLPAAEESLTFGEGYKRSRIHFFPHSMPLTKEEK